MYIYLLATRESIRCGDSTYKIGKSEQKDVGRRLMSYPKGCQLFLAVRIDDEMAEIKLLEIFRKKFEQKKDDGAEYFKGDVDEMINEIFVYKNQRKTSVVYEDSIPQHSSNTEQDFVHEKDILELRITKTGNKHGEGYYLKKGCTLWTSIRVEETFEKSLAKCYQIPLEHEASFYRKMVKCSKSEKQPKSLLYHEFPLFVDGTPCILDGKKMETHIVTPDDFFVEDDWPKEQKNINISHEGISEIFDNFPKANVYREVIIKLFVTNTPFVYTEHSDDKVPMVSVVTSLLQNDQYYNIEFPSGTVRTISDLKKTIKNIKKTMTKTRCIIIKTENEEIVLPEEKIIIHSQPSVVLPEKLALDILVYFLVPKINHSNPTEDRCPA